MIVCLREINIVIFFGAPQTPSWGTRKLRVLVYAALYIFSSGKKQGKLREFHSGFPVGTLENIIWTTAITGAGLGVELIDDTTRINTFDYD